MIKKAISGQPAGSVLYSRLTLALAARLQRPFNDSSALTLLLIIVVSIRFGPALVA